MQHLSWGYLAFSVAETAFTMLGFLVVFIIPSARGLIQSGMPENEAFASVAQAHWVAGMCLWIITMAMNGHFIARHARTAKYANVLVFWGIIVIGSLLFPPDLPLGTCLGTHIINLGGTLGGAWFAQRQ